MIITDVRIGRLSIPLVTPFKTALRQVVSVEDIIVELHTDCGNIGYGEAPPTAVITGDTHGSIISAINGFIKPNIVGRDIEDFEGIMLQLNNCMVGNTSAKAAVDMALWDLYGQRYNAPVYKLLGGDTNNVKTDITISVNEPDEMVRDSLAAIQNGFNILKVKVGSGSNLDIDRLKAIGDAVGKEVQIRIDANQGWSPRQSVRILEGIYPLGLNIELVEQPVKAHDYEGLKFVKDNSPYDILADESVFSAKDAIRLLEMRAADLINIKLMKAGGIYNALKICAVAEIYSVECMIGCMLESKLSVNAAVHLACAKNAITKCDLDGPALCRVDPVIGGALFNGPDIIVSDEPGLGIKGIDGLEYIS